MQSDEQSKDELISSLQLRVMLNEIAAHGKEAADTKQDISQLRQEQYDEVRRVQVQL